MKYFMLRMICLISASFVLISGKVKDLKTEEAELGKQLFFDPILSRNQTISCASCHRPQFAFSDSVALSTGDNGLFGKRNAPSVMNQSDRPYFFYDGRAATLEEQAIFPIEDPLEMNLPIKEAIARLQSNPAYAGRFRKIYGEAPNRRNLGSAIAAFERTLETSQSPWDLYAKGNTSAVDSNVLKGRKLFNEKGRCFECHSGTDFTNDEFRNIGTFNAKEWNDSGRAQITHDPADAGKFKVPGLRNIAVTGPYMHNGRFSTLREVIAFYNKPDEHISGAINRDTILNEPLNLTDTEILQLESFLNSLTDQRFLKPK